MVLQEEEPSIWAGSSDEQLDELEAPAPVQGGRERGLILHKLMEEILTGEIDEAEASLTERAAELIHAAGHSPVADPSTGLSAEELASCVLRTLSLPEIKALRPELLAEFPVYTARTVDGKESVTASVADALTLTKEGQPQAVVDWKSDVAADAQTIDHYRAQVQANIDTTGAERGLIVMMGQGSVIHVQPTHLSHA